MIGRDVAQVEVEKWLTARGTTSKKKERFADNIETLIDAFEEGILELDDNFVIVQNLQIPIGENGAIKQLKLKLRLTVGEVNDIKQGNKVKATDGDSTVLAYISAITEQPFSLIRKLDVSDYNVCQNVAVFFL